MSEHGFTDVLYCVTEGDDAAVRYVARLAARTKSDLTIADVLEDVPPLVRRLLPRSWDLPALVRAQKQARIDRSAALARRFGVEPETLLLTGAPIPALVKQVTRGGHDLLAVDVAATGVVQCVGASATRLLREVPCPVLLVRPSRRRRRPRVLVAVDTGPWLSNDSSALAAKLLETALWFTRIHDAELHVLHAWVPYGERMIVRAGLPEVESRQFMHGLRQEAREELDRTLAPFHPRIDSARVHLVKGDARKVIGSFASDYQIDLLVVGSVGRSGVAGRIIGNTAEAVMSDLPCSMLVVKPDAGGTRGRRTAR